MKVLVTGGAGFIGHHTVKELVSRGYDTIVLDNLSTGDLERLPEDVKCIHGDITNPELFESLNKVDAIIHLAAKVSVKESMEKPREYEEVNVKGTINVLEYMVNKSVKKLVFSSSAAVYGEPEYLPIDEKHPLKPKSVYAATKIAAEYYIRVYQSEYGIEPTIFRYFNVYGPGQNPNSEYSGVITIFEERAKSGLPLIVYGDGDQTRDFIHVSEVAKWNVEALENDKLLGIFNLGSGKETSINELAKQIIRKYNGKSEIIYKPPRKGDIQRSVADISLLRQTVER